MGQLSHAYTHTLVHYKRGLPDDIKDYERQHYINRVQFDFYSETYFYFFASVRDTIAQLINIYYDIGFIENEIHLNLNFLKKLQDTDIKNILKSFINNTLVTKDYRNTFAHRYLLTQEDYRPTITYENGSRTYSAGAGNAVKPSKLVAEIKSSLNHLATLLKELKPLLKAAEN